MFLKISHPWGGATKRRQEIVINHRPSKCPGFHYVAILGSCVLVFLVYHTVSILILSKANLGRARARVWFDCVLVLSFVMGYILKFGEIVHKRVQ